MDKVKNGGITLVALVITVIILLILAGITISQLSGSGLFENAKLAKEKSENSQEKEEGILSNYENQIEGYLNNSREQIMVDKGEYENLKSQVTSLKKQLADSKTNFLKSLTYLKTTELITADRSGNSQQFTLDSGKYILIAEARAAEYATNLSISGSTELIEIGNGFNTRWHGDGTYSEHYDMLVYGRGGSFTKMYQIDLTDSATLTFSITNTCPVDDSVQYVSVGRVAIYKFNED